MNWSVIYSVDTTKDVDIDKYLPEDGDWHETEGDEEFFLDDLEGQHRKLIAFLTNEEFKTFIDHTLYPYYVDNTMGMIGGLTPDGWSLGWMPAWSLSPDGCWDYGLYDQNAYVCPFPENEEEEQLLKSFDDYQIVDWLKKEYVR